MSGLPGHGLCPDRLWHTVRPDDQDCEVEATMMAVFIDLRTDVIHAGDEMTKGMSKT